ncbi:hypothetical protein YSY34_31090 [Brevibacillus brevis]
MAIWCHSGQYEEGRRLGQSVCKVIEFTRESASYRLMRFLFLLVELVVGVLTHYNKNDNHSHDKDEGDE